MTIFFSTCFRAFSGSAHDAEVVYFGHIVTPRIKWVNFSAIMNESGGSLVQLKCGSYEIGCDKQKYDFLNFFSFFFKFTI